jgi:2-hydroxy-6-oxonona-2,4-dienedioate hydrolase
VTSLTRWRKAGEVKRIVTAVGSYRISARVWSESRSLPVVLVHGFGVSGRYWHPLAKHLAPVRTVWVPDLPGHGESPGPVQALNVPELAAVLARWMEAVGIGRAVLAGNSLGCQTAAELAAHEPARVEALVLAGPTVDPRARSALAQAGRLALSAAVEHPAIYPRVLADYARAGPRRLVGELNHMLRHRIEDVLPRVAAPALVIRGAFDRVTPRRWAREVTRMLPHGRLTEIPLGGHAAHYSRAGRVASAILEFLD